MRSIISRVLGGKSSISSLIPIDSIFKVKNYISGDYLLNELWMGSKWEEGPSVVLVRFAYVCLCS